MSEKISCGERMTAAVSNARDWANKLVTHESRGPGDTENAMHRLETRYGISWRTFWSLRYRPPPDMLVSVYERLQAAYQAECERQMGLLRHEIGKARLTGKSVEDLAAEAESLAEELRRK